MDYLQVGAHKSDGQSLRDLIEKKPTNQGDYVVTEWDYRGPIQPNYMIVRDGWKLMIPYAEDSKVINAMYNLNDDPHETINLLGSNPDKNLYIDKAKELKSYLLDWLKERNSKHLNGVQGRTL